MVGWSDGWSDGRMDGGWIDGWLYGWVVGWRLDRWMIGYFDGCVVQSDIRLGR